MIPWGTRLRVLRALRDISQEDIAAATGLARVTISSYEVGRSLPSVESEHAIRQALGWTPEMDAALEKLGGDA